MIDPRDLTAMRQEHIRVYGWDLFRPRDESDGDVHPETARGKALDMMDKFDSATESLRRAIDAAPFYVRWVARAYCRLRGIRL